MPRHTRTRTRTVVVRSRRRHFSSRFMGSKKIPLSVIAGLVPGLKEPVGLAIQGNFTNAGKTALAYFTGWDLYQNNWNTALLKRGLYPLLGGMAVHWVANASGANRFISRFLKGLPVEI